MSAIKLLIRPKICAFHQSWKKVTTYNKYVEGVCVLNEPYLVLTSQLNQTKISGMKNKPVKFSSNKKLFVNSIFCQRVFISRTSGFENMIKI